MLKINWKLFVLKDSDDEQRYKCSFHARQSDIPSKNNDSSYYHQTPSINNRRPFNKRTNSFVVETSLDGTGCHQRTAEGPRRTQSVTRGATRNTWTGDRVARNMAASSSHVEAKKLLRRTAVQKGEKSSRLSAAAARSNADLEMTESVWITRESLHCTAKDEVEEDSMRSSRQQQRGSPLHQNNIRTNNENCSEHLTKLLPIGDYEDRAAATGQLHRSGDCFSAARLQQQQQPPDPRGCCNKAVAMAARKRAIAEWQVMAAIVDRLLFWIFLLATVFTYLVILVGVPLLKSETSEFVPLSSNVMHVSDNHLSSRLVTTSQGQIGHND